MRGHAQGEEKGEKKEVKEKGRRLRLRIFTNNNHTQEKEKGRIGRLPWPPVTASGAPLASAQPNPLPRRQRRIPNHALHLIGSQSIRPLLRYLVRSPNLSLHPLPFFPYFAFFFSFSFPAPLFAPRRWHSRKPKIAGSCCAERAEGVIGAATLYEDVVTPRAAVPNSRQVSPKIVGREAPGRACSSCGARVYL